MNYIKSLPLRLLAIAVILFILLIALVFAVIVFPILFIGAPIFLLFCPTNKLNISLNFDDKDDTEQK